MDPARDGLFGQVPEDRGGGSAIGRRRGVDRRRLRQAITGGHWNGPKFFGLSGSKAMVGAAKAIASNEKARALNADNGSGVAP